MQFTYHEDASLEILEIENDLYKYLIKARRHKVDDIIPFRNLKNNNIFFYKIVSIDRRKAICSLVSSEEKVVQNFKKLHIGWCIVDPKTIEKQLPYLNELGVESISFIYSDYSQKNFKLNFEKFEKILINSCQQCGRSILMKFEVFDSLDEYLKSHSDAYLFNFSKKHLCEIDNIDTIVVGTEGGFSNREIELFDENRIVGINSNLILRSETAVTTLAAKLIV